MVDTNCQLTWDFIDLTRLRWRKRREREWCGCWFSAKLTDSQPTCRGVEGVSLKMTNINGR